MKMINQEYLNLNVVNVNEKETATLAYNEQIEKRLIQEAVEGYPYETVGFLLGRKTEQEIVHEIYPVTNQAAEQERRFAIHDLDYIKVETYALAKQLDVIGIYHSHPDYPAIPSIHDLEYAQPEFAYVIVSIDATGFSLINAWKLKEQKFIQQSIQLI